MLPALLRGCKAGQPNTELVSQTTLPSNRASEAGSPGAAPPDEAEPRDAAELLAAARPADELRAEAQLAVAACFLGAVRPLVRAADAEQSPAERRSNHAAHFRAKSFPAHKSSADEGHSWSRFLLAVQRLRAAQFRVEGTRSTRSADVVPHFEALDCCVQPAVAHCCPAGARYLRSRPDGSQARCKTRRRGWQRPLRFL